MLEWSTFIWWCDNIHLFFFSSRWKFRNRKPVVDLLDAQKYFQIEKYFSSSSSKGKDLPSFVRSASCLKRIFFFNCVFRLRKKKHNYSYMHFMEYVACAYVCLVMVGVGRLYCSAGWWIPWKIFHLIFECDTIWVCIQLTLKRNGRNEPCGHL